MSELLGLDLRPNTPVDNTSSLHMPNSQGMQAKLVKADFHGSIISGVYITHVIYEVNNSPLY
jgi:ribonuclease P protein subunit POP4